MNDIEKLQNYINTSKYTVAITGAGISVASGIASMHGLNLVETLQFASKTVLRLAPEHYYKIARHSFLDAIFNNGPSLSHRKLAKLEEKDKIQGIITTNLDGLHFLAGSKNVAEIQGSFIQNTCLKCGKRTDDIYVWNKGKAPRCECGGLLCCYPVYSHVGILREEANKAKDYMSKADLIIIIGAIGNYASVYWHYRKPNVKIVQINPSKTYFDNVSDINIKEKSDDVLKYIE